MHVWTSASARATIGAPTLESRIPCKAAEFHRIGTDCERVLSARPNRRNDAAMTQENFIPCWRGSLQLCRVSPVTQVLLFVLFKVFHQRSPFGFGQQSRQGR